MKLEDQVCSLELAKRLKELGVKQESLFKWIHDGNGFRVHSLMLEPYPANWIVADAFTVAELGEILPGFIHGFLYGLKCWKTDFQECSYSINYKHTNTEVDPENGWLIATIVEKTEANSRAKMLIHLIEKGIVKP